MPMPCRGSVPWLFTDSSVKHKFADLNNSLNTALRFYLAIHCSAVHLFQVVA